MNTLTHVYRSDAKYPLQPRRSHSSVRSPLTRQFK